MKILDFDRLNLKAKVKVRGQGVHRLNLQSVSFIIEFQGLLFRLAVAFKQWTNCPLLSVSVVFRLNRLKMELDMCMRDCS